jgi:cytochrome c553
MYIPIRVALLCLLLAQGAVEASDQSADGLPYDHASNPVSAADAATGEKVYMDEGCIECHGPRGISPDPDMFPRIAGLEQQYIVDQLTAFQSGSRQNVIMSPVAATLSNDDIWALAAFISAKKQDQ